MDDFQEVLSKIRIEEIIHKYTGVQPKRMGTWLDFGECPFCQGHDCFRVRADQGSFYCFQCAIGGNAIVFLRRFQKLSSNFEALKILAKEINYNLDNGRNIQKKNKDETTKENIFSIAAAYYHRNLMNDKKAYDWIQRHRFHPKEILTKFMIGWSGDSQDGLINHLKENKFTESDMLKSGLIKENKDFFASHLYIYPWLHHSFVGHFSMKDPLKKLNYQLANQFRHKDLFFYNQADLFRDQIIIVEGENDLLTTYRALSKIDSRYKNFGVVAIHGQISQDQLNYLKAISNGKEFYFCFDNDPAGEKYLQKAIDTLHDVAELYVMKVDSQFKDVDEFLREKSFPESDLANMLEDTIDGLEWQIQHLSECDNALKARKIVIPVLENISHIKDDRLDTYVDLLANKYPSLKRSNIIKQLKSLGAQVGINEIRNFEVYDSASQIYVSNHCYWVPTKDDKRMISNFEFRLVNIYNYEDAQTHDHYLKYECIMKNYKSISSESIIFDPEERVNINKFMAKAASRGEYHFWGNSQNLLNIWSFVESQAEDVKVTHLIQKYGFLENHEIWLFENCAIKNGKLYQQKDGIINIAGKGYKSENVLIYGGDKPVMNIEKIEDQFIDEVIYNFWKICDGHFVSSKKDDFSSFKGLLLLGFIPAMIYRREIMAQYGLFPILTAYGPRQTGKSVITQIMSSFWGFSNPAEAWEGMTPPGLTQFFSQVNSLPVWLDEFRNNSNRYHKTLMGLIRNAYNGVAPGKGGLSKRLIFNIGGVLWLSGEDTPDDAATISRCTVARFTDINPIRTEAYNWFQQHKYKLSAITLKLILEKTKDKSKQFLENIESISDILLRNGISDERTRINLAIPVAGFHCFDYRKDDKQFQQDFIDYISLQAEEDRQRKMGEDILTKFFEDMARLMEKDRFSDCVKIIENEELVFCFNEFYAEYKKELRLEGDNIDDFKKTTIRDYIVKSPFFLYPPDGRSEFVVRFGEKTKRAFKLSINKMPEHYRELFDKSILEEQKEIF